MPKIIKVGSSLGVTIPREDLAALDLKQGDDVVIQRRGSHLEIIPIVMRPKLRPEVQDAVDRTVERFGPALKKLAE